MSARVVVVTYDRSTVATDQRKAWLTMQLQSIFDAHHGLPTWYFEAMHWMDQWAAIRGTFEGDTFTGYDYDLQSWVTITTVLVPPTDGTPTA